MSADAIVIDEVSAPVSTFHLVPDGRLHGASAAAAYAADEDASPPQGERALPPMWAVRGPSSLGFGPDAELAFAPLGDGETGAPRSEGEGHAPAAPRYLFEPLSSGTHPRLIMLTADPAPRARVNGHAAPRLAVLSPGDQVVVERGSLVHVVLHHPDAVVRTPAGLVGTECPLCRVPLATGDRVYLCHQCGSAVHRASEPTSPDAPVLECVLALQACPVCEHPVRLEAGFSHEPWA